MKFLLMLLLVLTGGTGYALQYGQVQPKQIRVGLLDGDLPLAERKALDAFLGNRKDIKVIKLDYAQIAKNAYKKLGLTHVWIHKLSPTFLTSEKKSGTALLNFVKQGGQLLLSMEAVLLLNSWGIEKNKLEVRTDSVKDEGFGRPRGFHAFKSHPLFNGLNGGVYSWKGKTDHVIRKIGFFDHHLPDTNLAKVIGIEWTYITFLEQNKLVFEYNIGRGRIIAVGAYSYFSRPNINGLQLHKFYENLLDYTAGLMKQEKVNYWSYQPRKVAPTKRQFPALKVTPATRLNLPTLSLQLQRDQASKDFVSLAGRRMLLMGKQHAGIDEIWTHPFLSYKDIQTGLVFKGADTSIWLKDYQPKITISPEMLIREYTVNGVQLKEVITVSIEKPIAVIHYEWDSDQVIKLLMKYTNNFRYMWPYSADVAGSIGYQWVPAMNAVVSTAQNKDLASIIGFSTVPEHYQLGQYDTMQFRDGVVSATKTDLVQLGGIFSFDAKASNGNFNAYLVAGNEGLDKTLACYQNEQPKFEEIFQSASRHFVKLKKESTELITPDTAFNEGYNWAIARSDQFFQETPGLGLSLMAGFGPTTRGWNGAQKISGRPGYAWYFGRDAQWSGLAINAYGGYKMIKNTLDVFVKFQDLNGKIYHELTSSGAVHYDASDATPLYVVLAANYLKHSGDLSYIRKIWPSLLKAMDFCYSTDTDGDGLIEITNVGHGWIEGGALFGAHTEIYLAGTWVAALDAASYVANALGKTTLANRYKGDSKKVSEIIDRDFWDKKQEHFYNGKMVDGSYMQDETVLATIPVYFNAVTDSKKAIKTVGRLFGNDFTTDWGLRMVSEKNSKYNPGAYHEGMVWPLFTGFSALANYKTGFHTNGFSNVINNLMLYQNWGLGSAEETLHGATFKPAGVCSQQCWSETMIIQPILEGMLGFSCDALTHKINLSPNIPLRWDTFTAKQIQFGNHNITLEMKRSVAGTTYTLNYLAKSKDCIVNFSPSLPLGTKITRLLVNGKETPYNLSNEVEGIRLHFADQRLTDKLLIEVLHEGGIAYLPAVNSPKPGDVNKNLKLIHQELNKNQFSIEVEGRSGDRYSVDLMSNFEVLSIKNASVTKKSGNIYTIQFILPSENEKYMKQRIEVFLKL